MDRKSVTVTTHTHSKLVSAECCSCSVAGNNVQQFNKLILMMQKGALWSPGWLTCVSVSMSDVATSKRLGLDRYLLSLNWFSSSRSCWLVKAVRGLLHFPSRPDWGPAGRGTAKLSVCVRLTVTVFIKKKPKITVFSFTRDRWIFTL